MNSLNHFTDGELTDLEKKLFHAACQLPGPSKPMPLSPVMADRRDIHPVKRRFILLWYTPVWRTVILVLALFCAGTTTVLAASPRLREAVIHFLTSGTVEQPLTEQLDPGVIVLPSAGETISAVPDSNIREAPKVQTAGSLTLVQPEPLDSHMTAMYASSPDYLDLVHTPSGAPLFCTISEDGVPVYYAAEDGILKEIRLEPHSLTTSVQLENLPGVMPYAGDPEAYQSLTLPAMEFTVIWQQYGEDVLIDDILVKDCWNSLRFNIQDTFGGGPSGDLSGGPAADFDGGFSCSAIPGRSDRIIVSFHLDSQMTGYSYPFLLDLTTGEISDPLAAVDLTAYPCITDLALSGDLTCATAMAGQDHDSLRKITVDLTSGQCTEASLHEAPAEDCLTWFPVSEYTVFYATGSAEQADGFLYDTRTKTSLSLFTDAAQGYAVWEDGFAEKYFSAIGGGYLLYYEGDTVSLLDLHDGSLTLLEGIPARRDVSCFFNPDFTVLSISVGDGNPETGNTSRLCFLDLATKKAWYFDRDLPEGISEQRTSWYGPYGYMIQAKNDRTGLYYLYLYDYAP